MENKEENIQNLKDEELENATGGVAVKEDEAERARAGLSVPQSAKT